MIIDNTFYIIWPRSIEIEMREPGRFIYDYLLKKKKKKRPFTEI